MKIIILGAGGFLGTKLTSILSKEYSVYPLYRKKDPKIDITNKKDILYTLTKENPDIVIHAAGLTNVDLCETDKKLAEKVNVLSTKYIVEACNKINCKLIYFSTDFVFSGNKGKYTEEENPTPINNYALTKLKAEKIIQNSLKEYVIARVAILYGYNGNSTERSFVKWMYESLKEGKKIDVVDDQIGTPTLIDDVASAIIRLIENRCTGIYHIAGPQRLSRYEMAIKLCGVFGFDKCLINPVKSGELGLPAKRPMDTSLSINKLKKEGVFMHSFDEGIRIMKQEMES